MEIRMDLTPAANQFNTRPVGGGTAKLSAVKGAYLNTGDETSKVEDNDLGTFTERLANAFRTDNADVIRALDDMSLSDKLEIATRSYLQMQGRVLSATAQEENDIATFRSLKEEKEYYSELLRKAKEKGGITELEEGGTRYDFKDRKAGTLVTAEEIKDALGGVQERIDNFLAPYGRDEEGHAINNEKDNERMTRDYIAYASAFEEVTGLTADCLDPGDKLLLHKLDRTEENYLQKAGDYVDALKGMSKDLHDLMERYKASLEIKTGEADLSEEARARLEAFEFIREQFSTGKMQTLGVLDTQA